MTSSKLTAEERLLRKRQAARIRQQRCRARKRQALLEKQRKVIENAKGDSGNEKDSTFTAKQNAMQRAPPPYPIEQSPRSVFWNDAPRGSWAIPSASPEYIRRYPSFEQKRRMYGPDAEHRPMYYRHPTTFPWLRPRVEQHAKPATKQFFQRKHPASRFYVYQEQESREPEYYRSPIESDCNRQGWVPPKIPMLRKSEMILKGEKEVREEVVIESKEEAAVDAILSLKSVKSESAIVPPPKIQRVSAEPTSAFQKYRGPGPTRPSFYLPMRVAKV
mmetsp:Transcript_16935/g.25727  ORF Transcript_16935/g.25727 Transcript_16935/m.25727 type:complete len:275 (-) Transcript_16935:12-836(-)